MAEIIHFVARAELTADENLDGFVAVCRDVLKAFDPELDFDSDVWDVSHAIRLKARNGAVRLYFYNQESIGASVQEPLMEPFKSFAKAYLRYQHAFRPSKLPGIRLAALRALEAACRELHGAARPSRVTSETLNRAAQLLWERFTPGVAYRTAGHLEVAAAFMAKHRLLSSPFTWRNPLARPLQGTRVGKEFDEERNAKLPSPGALSALAKAFHLATEPADVLTVSIAALLCASPDRINEALRLPLHCEVNQTIPSTGEPAYGLRWYPAKGAQPMVKWIVPSMADVVKEALRKIRALTEPARALARWYEANPKRLYLPPELEHLRGKAELSMSELGDILLASPANRNSMRVWCLGNNVPTKMVGKNLVAAFADFERTVLAMLPTGFPVMDASQGLKYSDALCVVRTNELHAQRGTYACMFHGMDTGHVQQRLSSNTVNVFDRLGLTDEDGSPVRITTHQFRHYLNTMAQVGGLSQLDIAKWSGRADIRQNAAYDHQSDRDILALVRAAVGDAKQLFGPLATQPRSALIPRDEFARLRVATAHTTEFGYCIHDFSMLPCQSHRDCLNCDEQVCVKGDLAREANLRRQLDETKELLEAAKSAEREGYAGANRWVAHQTRTLERLEELIQIIDNPAVPTGAVIQIARAALPSSLERASVRKLELAEQSKQ